jgi:hypothetical protein
MTMPAQETATLLHHGLSYAEQQTDIPIWRVGIDTPRCASIRLSTEPALAFGLASAIDTVPDVNLVEEALRRFGQQSTKVVRVRINAADHYAGCTEDDNRRIWMYSPLQPKLLGFPPSDRLQTSPQSIERARNFGIFIHGLQASVRLAHVDAADYRQDPWQPPYRPSARLAIACANEQELSSVLNSVEGCAISDFNRRSLHPEKDVLSYRLLLGCGLATQLSVSYRRPA